MKFVRYISVLIMVLTINSIYSQQWTEKAYAFYKAENIEKAKTAIDSAINTTERFDSQTWQLRGAIYNKFTNENKLFYREIAIESFLRSKDLDSTGVYTTRINDYIFKTILRYYNESVTLLLDDMKFIEAEASYDLYKEYHRTLVAPNHDFTLLDIQFYNAMGSQYLFKADMVKPSEKMEWRLKAIKYCGFVVERDSLDSTANFNLGITYYNMGVDFVITVEPVVDIDILISNQLESEKSFLNALPYLHIAKNVKQNKKEVWFALVGCYYGLNNNKMYLKYQTILDKIDLPMILKNFEKNPTNISTVKELVRIYSKTLINAEEAERFKKILYDLRKDL